MSGTRCTNCGADLSSTCCNHPGRVLDFPMDFPPDTIPGLEAEIAQLRAERDAAMAGRVKVKPLVWRHREGGNGPEWDATCRVLETGWTAYSEDAKRAIEDMRYTRILAAIQPDTERAEPVADADLYLICKYGGYYRPDASGYTRDINEAGRYTLDEAIKHTHPNGSNGPRDGMTYIPAPAPQAREITVREAARVPEVRALIEAAKSAADALDMAYGDPHDEETQHRYSSDIRAALRALTGEAR